MADNAEPGRANRIGMPGTLLLHEFGSQVWAAFGVPPYHVGSSLMASMGGSAPPWRDVDVRVILDDAVYEAMGLGKPCKSHQNGKWVALCLAFSALGEKMTGMPIDFQIQQQSKANRDFDGPRSAIGLIPLRFANYID